MSSPLTRCSDFLRKNFPAIDDDLFQYVNDVLASSAEDFEGAEDVYEAVGPVLQEVDAKKSEDEIKSLCQSLHSFLNLASETSNGHRTLETPFQMESLTQVDEVVDSNVWIQKAEDSLKVDSKKLEKAEQQLLKKQDKKAANPESGNTAVRYKTNEATASQVISKKDGKNESNVNTKDIRIENFDISFGDKVLLRGANLTLIYGRRYGMVGRNGLGKSTLLKMISGGQLIIPNHISVLHVEQEIVGDDTLALQSVLESDTKREGLLAEEKRLTADDPDSPRLAQVYVELEAIESDKAPSRASIILSGLGFTPQMQGRATKTFSGGWRMRLALARALFCR